MGDYLHGEKISTTYQQFVAIGGTSDRDGIHATTQKAVWTDDGAGGTNAFPFTAARDAIQLVTDKKIEFRDAAIYIQSSGDGVLSLAADGTVVIGTLNFDVNATGAVTIDGVGISIGGSAASDLTITGGNLTMSTVTSGEMYLTPVNFVQVASGKKLQFADSGEYVSGNGTDLTLGSGVDINLTATSDINVPSNVGLTFGDDGEKIEGDGTNLTIASSGLLNLTATSDIVIPTNVGLHFTDANEKIESDGTNLTFN